MPLPAGKTKITEGTLTIKNLSPADSGYYVCIASIAIGTRKVRLDLEGYKNSHVQVGVRLWFNWVQYKILACVTAAFVTLVRTRVEVLLLDLCLRLA